MKITFLFTVILVGASIIGAYFSGRYVATRDADQRFGLAFQNVEALDSAATLQILSSAIENLRASKIREADAVLTSYGNVKLSKVMKCSEALSCSAALGRLARSSDEFKRAQALPAP